MTRNIRLFILRLSIFVCLIHPPAAWALTDAFGLSVTCTGTGPVTCTRSDGLEVENGTAQTALNSFAGMAPASWTPPVVVPTTIAAYDFVNRFTKAEQVALSSANPLWGILIAAKGIIDVTDATLLADLQAAVTAGLLTAPRAAQVVNLAVSSP